MRRTTRTTFVAAVVAAISMLMANFAFGAELVIAELEATENRVTVTAGETADFNLTLWATGNYGKCDGSQRTSSQASVHKTFNISATNAVTSSTFESVTFTLDTTTDQGNGQCLATQRTAATGDVVAASVTTHADTTPGTYTVLLKKTNNDSNVTTGSGIDDATGTTLTFEVVAADTGPDCTSDRGQPAAPTITLTGDPDATTGWFNADADDATFTISPAQNAEYSLDGGTTWTAYDDVADEAEVTDEGEHSVIARNFLPATDDCDRVDGTASSATDIDLDRTAPEVNPGDVDDTMWRNTSLSEDFTAEDETSGLADETNDASFTLTVSVASTLGSNDDPVPTVDSRDVYDVAGNVTTRSVSALIDLIPPTSEVDGVTDGAVYVAGFVPNISCVGSDDLSGIDDDGTLASNTAAGVTTVSCNDATDNAGNIQTAASAEVSYTVVSLGGFNSNFDGSSVLKAKAGSAIPLKWAFSNGTTNHDILSRVTASQETTTACTNDPTLESADLSNATASGGSDLQRLDDGSYQYNWKSVKSDTGCRRMTLRMYDANDTLMAKRSVVVNFTK